LGVAATHLDWTMVPYVRKSFNKHYKDGMKYVENKLYDDNILDVTEVSIDDDFYKKNSKAYEYAMDMTVKEIHQATEGLYHNLNSLMSRSGEQLPFSSINYGTCTLTEGRMIIKELLEVSIEGVGRLHKTSVFPCGIMQIGEGINKHEGDPNYDLFKLAIKSTALRLYPNYCNIDWSVNAGYDKNDPRTFMTTMGGHKLQPM
jgi:ribonucleoside-triphosphate reductase